MIQTTNLQISKIIRETYGEDNKTRADGDGD